MIITAVTCLSPPVESLGSQSPAALIEAPYNSSVLYECNHGYWYDYGNNITTLKCNSEGDWFPNYTCCKGWTHKLGILDKQFQLVNNRI